MKRNTRRGRAARWKHDAITGFWTLRGTALIVRRSLVLGPWEVTGRGLSPVAEAPSRIAAMRVCERLARILSTVRPPTYRIAA